MSTICISICTAFHDNFAPSNKSYIDENEENNIGSSRVGHGCHNKRTDNGEDTDIQFG
jgi:hypothetical protein